MCTAVFTCPRRGLTEGLHSTYSSSIVFTAVCRYSEWHDVPYHSMCGADGTALTDLYSYCSPSPNAVEVTSHETYKSQECGKLFSRVYTQSIGSPPRGPDVTSSESQSCAASHVHACACTCSITCARMCMYLQHHMCTHVHVLAASHVYACACTCSITCVRMCMYLQHHMCTHVHVLAASRVYACACTCSITCACMCMYLQHHMCTHVHVLAASHVYACAFTCSITCVVSL